jgi:2-haloacid dehalogenase
VSFTDIGSAVMKMFGGTRGITISETDKKELVDKFSTMPYPELPQALQKLRDAGFRLFTLTDNLPTVQKRQLEHGASSICSSGALVQTMLNITSPLA